MKIVFIVLLSFFQLTFIFGETRINSELTSRPVIHASWQDPRGIVHKYYFSWETSIPKELDWLSARKFCRRHGMDTVSIESQEENDYIKTRIAESNVKYIWTSGRKCNYRIGCQRIDLQPNILYGWYWTGSGARITPEIWDWSFTGDLGKEQPDNMEMTHQSNDEACLSIMNNYYEDGIKWHDIACHHLKPFVCEETHNLLDLYWIPDDFLRSNSLIYQKMSEGLK